MKPYNEKDRSKGEEVRTMFDRIAPKYDLLNHTLSAGIDKLWRRRVVKMVRREEPKLILDVATGTGDLAIALARRIPHARIVAVDLSEGMLAEARRKVENAGLTEAIELKQGAAEHLDELSEGIFDVVTVAFGVRNFDNMEAGLRELYRLLRPGGKLVVLEFSNPTHPLIAGLYRWYSHAILPRIGGAISKDRSAYEYLPASVDEFPSPDSFRRLLTEIGFCEAGSRSQSLGIAQIHSATKPANQTAEHSENN